MYNLTVADAHTFFVGDGDWLVHNEACRLVLDEEGKIIGFEGDLPGEGGVQAPRMATPEEMSILSQQAGEIEFAQGQVWQVRTEVDANGIPYNVYEPTDNWWLYSGVTSDPESVSVPVYFDGDPDLPVQNQSHTHPSGKTTPSSADIDDLRARHWQDSSAIITYSNGQVIVNPYNANTPPVDN